jgi:hypothetical protein
MNLTCSTRRWLGFDAAAAWHVFAPRAEALKRGPAPDDSTDGPSVDRYGSEEHDRFGIGSDMITSGSAVTGPLITFRRPWAMAWRAIASALLIAHTTAVAYGQNDEVDIQVFNASFQAVNVEIFDDICRQSVFQGEILNNSSASVACCPDQNGMATITIVDRFGRRQTYSGLADASTVNVGTE